MNANYLNGDRRSPLERQGFEVERIDEETCHIKDGTILMEVKEGDEFDEFTCEVFYQDGVEEDGDRENWGDPLIKKEKFVANCNNVSEDVLYIAQDAYANHL